MYFPWSTDLLGYFQVNIADMEKAIKTKDMDGTKVIVFLSTSPFEAQMFEIISKNGTCIHTSLKEYENPQFTTKTGLTEILKDMKRFAPAKSYAMIVGCHGMGWLSVMIEDLENHKLGKVFDTIGNTRTCREHVFSAGLLPNTKQM